MQLTFFSLTQKKKKKKKKSSLRIKGGEAAGGCGQAGGVGGYQSQAGRGWGYQSQSCLATEMLVFQIKQANADKWPEHGAVT